MQIQLAPLAKWAGATFIQKRASYVEGAKHQIVFDDKTTMDYSVLSLNLGSKTKNFKADPSALRTRPINYLIS